MKSIRPESKQINLNATESESRFRSDSGKIYLPDVMYELKAENMQLFRKENANRNYILFQY